MSAPKSRDSRIRTPRRLALTAGVFILVGVIAALFATTHPFGGGSDPSSKSPPGPAGSKAAFTFLSQQGSNYCSLDTKSVEHYANGTQLQGACCNSMDQHKYEYQVTNLRQNASIPQIPTDPYDIPVSLAKQLIGYDGSITLNSDQQAFYDRAMGMTEDKGPCCCHCWRWYMTRGLVKYLITEHNMDAPNAARVVDLVNGCGGPLEASAGGPPPPA